MNAIFFWLAVGLVFYVYFGYPILIGLLARFSPKPKPYLSYTPSITLLIAAYNESAVIAQKLENCLQLDYPRTLLQILLVDDGSEDDTAEIVRTFIQRGIELISYPDRRGKMSAIVRGMDAARGEIVVMSDASNMYSPDTIKELAAPFVDPTVGVTSGARIVPKGDGALGESEGLYWKYESWIKEQETRLGACLNVAGIIYAFRRSLYIPPPKEIINDDFYIMMSIVKKGFRVIYTPRAKTWERVSETAADEMERRARIVAGRYQAMGYAARLLPFDRPLIIWQVISHKFLRPLVPFGMIVALLANLAAVIWHPPTEGIAWLWLAYPYNWIFLGLQLFFYVIAVFGDNLKKIPFGKWLYVPAFLVNSNIAALVGLVRFVSRKQSNRWRRAQRQKETPHG